MSAEIQCNSKAVFMIVQLIGYIPYIFGIPILLHIYLIKLNTLID